MKSHSKETDEQLLVTSHSFDPISNQETEILIQMNRPLRPVEEIFHISDNKS